MLAENDCAVCSWIDQRRVKVILRGLRGEIPFAGWARTSVRRHPIAEFRRRPDEVAVLCARNIVLPDAIDQKSHAGLPNLRCSSFRLLQRVAPRAMDQNRPKC